MTEQSPEAPKDVVEATDDQAAVADAEPTEIEIVEAEVESTETAAEPEADADVVEAEVVGLDLGDEAPAAPVGTDFEVAESSHLSEAAPAGEFEVGNPIASVTPPIPSTPPVDPVAPAVPAAPTIPVSPPATGGSFLDLPPLPDLSYPAPTPPPASPYPPPAPSYPRAANYPQSAGYPQADYALYPADYSEQAAGQAYGHGTATPQQRPAPMAPANPYGTPTGFAVQPYQQGVPVGDVTMASAAHWGALVATVASGGTLGFLVPLIIMLTKGQNAPFVRANATESLNFNLTVLIGMVASALLVLIFVGIVGLIVIPVVALILQILGALAANRGEVYRYPVSIRVVK
ncbi:MAG: DUF4870 domain-containing protein [Propionibacteriaceae bacterium]|nr:DUF4870 domain-containing protein [Propionibacteriaceae bacterium]